MFDRSKGLTKSVFHDFFKWVPEQHYLASSDVVALVKVTSTLTAEYCATILPPNPVPPNGYYIIRRAEEVRSIYVEMYAQAEQSAIADVLEALADSFYGEDQPLTGTEF